jgi:hypothetical protein
MPLTLEQIREKGLVALQRELGRAGMIRFLQQFETGSGDYTRARHDWVDRMSMDMLVELSQARPATRKRRKS